ncbi:MAG: aminomethyl-transferring glycine dehydrogenase [Acidobacteriota bacterium]
MPSERPRDPFAHPDRFVDRHIGPREHEIREMLGVLGYESLEQLVDAAIPKAIRFEGDLDLPPALSEAEALARLREIGALNERRRSFIGLGYHGCHVPPVILRNVFENPGWYTQYTPYQPEISQGRLEALLNFQTMVCDLTGLEVANASLLDEPTAAAEAMTMAHRALRSKADGKALFVADDCHPQTLAVVATRAEALGIELVVGDPDAFDPGATPVFAALLQNPSTTGRVRDLSGMIERIHEAGALAIVATDLLASTLFRPAGEMGADIAVGSAQRFGVPMGYGGPHAGFMATRTQFQRQMPGRLVGVSRDSAGHPALRLALQTREQHIRREKATSNICTAQALLAIMASFYAVWHGPEGLTAIARRVHRLTRLLGEALDEIGCTVDPGPYFDTLHVGAGPARKADAVLAACDAMKINMRRFDDGSFGIALDETTRLEDVQDLFEAFGGRRERLADPKRIERVDGTPPEAVRRTTEFLQHPVFHRYHSETEMMRYITRLQQRDLSLATAMIPLGSCTMKLNAAAEMMPVSWPEFADLHPFVPVEQAAGYRRLFADLERWLAEITGFSAVSLQPNAGAQGEYTGLLVIRAWHRSRGEGRRDVCLVPSSAHGTNPASSVLAGLRVVVVGCDGQGNIDLDDLRAKAEEHRERLAALMVTYPSTHGVFEDTIEEVCRIVHDCGGQVYLDGANMNAMVGLARPADFGADVCHLNLHKTFAIPHGGGGPGVGPIGVAPHLAPFLPRHPLVETGGEHGIGPVAGAPFGSPLVLPISWAYIAMMGPDGMRRASEVAILNANYIARRLEDDYRVLYRGRDGLVAHECILDVRPFKASAGVDAEDIAKRLMDYGFHAPTMSWPVAGTLMVEPTESESRFELDRFVEAMKAIREEIREIEQGRADREDNLLKNAPHTAVALAAEDWPHPYSRERAAFPTPFTREYKFWPATGRIDNAWGDRHLVCSCPPVEAWAS